MELQIKGRATAYQKRGSAISNEAFHSKNGGWLDVF